MKALRCAACVLTILGLAARAQAASWPIGLSANGRYFVDASSNPWIMVGDSAHHIVNILLPAAWPTYFTSRQSQGFNTVNIMELTHANPVANGGLPGGQLPFTNAALPTVCGSAGSTDYDLSTPNPNYWSVIDQFINTAATYNMVVLFAPLTTASFMNDLRTSEVNTPGAVFAFGQFLGNRYKNFPNIIWELGNDFQTWSNGPACSAMGGVTDSELVRRMMAGIASADPNHLRTTQLNYYGSFSNQDSTIPVTANGVYNYYETYGYALQAYNSSPVLPTILVEANMEGIAHSLPSPATAIVLRRQMYWMMTSGASGHVWGNTHVNHFDSSWQSNLNTFATTNVHLLTNLLLSTSWWNLVPDQTHQIVTSGYGAYSPGNTNLFNSNFVTTAWDPGATLALVYASSGATLTVALGKFSAPVTAQWYDPTSGAFNLINGSPFAATGTNAFSTPGNNSAGDPDWVLVLQAAPGAAASVPLIISTLTASGTVGSPFSYQIAASNSPASFNATPLPAGLSVNAATGLISGTPASAGTTNVTVSAANAGGTGSATLALTVNPQTTSASSGWTWVQDNPLFFCQGSGITQCSMGQTYGNFVPTIPGSVWVVQSQAANPGVTIKSVTGGGGTWIHCPNCAVTNPISGISEDAWYNLSGNAGTGNSGTNAISFQLSGSAGSWFAANFVEFLPPAGTTVSYDDSGTAAPSTCAPACTAVQLSHITGTDVIWQNPGGGPQAAWNSWGAPYITDANGGGTALNVTSGAAPTVTYSGNTTHPAFMAIAFKASSSFTPPTPQYSIKNFTPINGLAAGGSCTQSAQGSGISCSPNCSFTIPATGAGHLLFLQAADTAGAFLKSVSGGGTWVVPSGSNSCQKSASFSSQNSAVSCAYVLSSNAGATSLNVTMSGTASTGFAVWEVATTSGPFALDTQGSTLNPGSAFFPGQPLTLSGQNDVIFQTGVNVGGSIGPNYYAQPYILNSYNYFLCDQAASVVLTDSGPNPPTPTWINVNVNTPPPTLVAGVAFKGGGSSTPPAPSINSALSVSTTVGAAFSYQITASNSPTSFGATGLPSGLAVNASNGLITGTPTAAGSSNVTITATNAGGTGSATLALTINSSGSGGAIGPVDAFIDMNGSTVGAPITTAMMPSNIIGFTGGGWSGYAPGSTFTSSPPGMSVGPHHASLLGSVIVNGVTYTSNHPTQSIAYDNGQNFSSIIANIPSGHNALTVAGFITFPPTDIKGNVMDNVRVDLASGHFCVMQPDNSIYHTPYGVRLHSDGGPAGGTIIYSNKISITPNVTYWYSMKCDFTAGISYLNLYDTSGALVGSVTPLPLVVGSVGINRVYIGNEEVGLAPGSTTYFEDTLIDYTNAAFPLGPGSPSGSPPAPVVTSTLSASDMVGTAFSYQITASNSPTSFNAMGLPAGLSVSTSNGLISGTPTAAGSANVTLSATNAGGTGSATLALTVNSASSGGAPWSGIIAPSRAVDWSQAGVAGGIPSRATICATFSPGATAAQISSALQSCNNGVVYLNAGTYNIAGVNFGGGKSNVTLRGAGADQTFLVFSGSASGCSLPADVCMESSDNNWGGGPSNFANWTAGYAKGTTVITLSSVTNLKVGNPLILDQLDSTQDDGSILVTPMTSTLPFTSPGLAGPYSVSGNAGAQRSGRQQEQIVTVTAINGNQVTISPGLYMPNWSAGSAPQAWWATSPASGLGLEDLSMDHTATNTSFNNSLGVVLKNCIDCWVSGVRDYNTARAHIQLKYANHVTVRDSYLALTQFHSTSSYGWECYAGSDNLAENNIIQGVASPLMFNGPCSGSVISYNFAINDYYTEANNNPSQAAPGYNINVHGDHTAGVDNSLIEGNYGGMIEADAIHGTHNLMTYFRNRFTGPQPACWQSGTVTPTNSTYPAGLTWGACTNNLTPFKLSAFSRFYNLVGNVLGTSGTNTGYINSGTSILSLGPGNGSVPSDPNVQGTVMLWGNYDTFNATPQFNAGEVPSALTGTQAPYANPVPAGQALPASFYLSAKPGWWPSSKPWPPVGPDVSGGNISGVAGHAYTLPAQDCYLNVMGGLANGTGPLLNFNAANCYSNTPQAPAITSALTASGAVGTTFSYQITASNGPTSFSASGLPAGLSVNTATGLISGTPTAAGTSSVTLSATNAGGTGSATLALTVNSSGGGVIVSTTCSQTDVQAAVNSAAEGDTVVIPAGTCSWTSGVTISGKGITVQGAGAGRVIAVDVETTALALGTGAKAFSAVHNDMGATAYLNAVPPPIAVGQTLRIIENGWLSNFMQGAVTSFNSATGALSMNITSSGGTCGTTIPNSMNSNCKRWLVSTIPGTVLVNNITSGAMFYINEDASFHTTITGIHFGQGSGGGGAGSNVFLARNNPNGTAVLIHDNFFESENADIIDGNTSRGVIWNNSFVFSPFSQGQWASIRTKDFNNTTMPASWSTPSTMGMADATGQGNLYFETNDIHADGNTTDLDDNSRTVLRYNVFDNAGSGTHGADTSYIGLRHFEYYNNVGLFQAYTDGSTANMNWWIFVRGGSFVWHDNVLPPINSQDWGTKADINMTVMTLQRQDSLACWGSGFTTPGQYYHAPRQVGMGYVTGTGTVNWPAGGYNNASFTTKAGGYTGSVYVGDSEPVYIWNNNRTMNVGLSNYGLNNGATSCPSSPAPDSVSNYLVQGRDYFNGTPKPGYTPYTYPHPLTSGTPAPPASAPVITSTLSASGTAGTAFSYQIAATNSPASFNAAPLPAGLSVNAATGLISGTPASAGTTNVTVSAANAAGSGSASLSLTINNPAPQAPVITSPLSASGAVGSPFSYQISATNGPTSFNAAGLPAGLSINTATGLISGTPSAAGTSSVAMSAANIGGTGSTTLTLTVNPAGSGKTITAPTCSQIDVANAVAQAANGDTVLIPACAQTDWTTQLTVNVGITLQGAGIDVTTIGDNVAKIGGGASNLFQFSVSSPNNFRLTGLTIVGVASDPNNYNQGHISLGGSSKAFRVDHVKLLNPQTSFMRVNGDLNGVIDHNVAANGGPVEFVSMNNTDWTSWQRPMSFGDGNAVFIEDNTIAWTGHNEGRPVADGQRGARVVFRHNNVTNAMFGNHGFDSGGTASNLQAEVYNNTFTVAENPSWGGSASWTWSRIGLYRGGTGLLFNNTFVISTNVWLNDRDVSLAVFRDLPTTTFPNSAWPACTGTQYLMCGVDKGWNTLAGASGPSLCASGGLHFCSLSKASLCSIDADCPSGETCSAFADGGGTGYPCYQQPGYGGMMHAQPLYAWGNSLSGSQSFHASNYPTAFMSEDSHVALNRDYFNNTPMPGYVPYPYPHPLVAGSTGPVAPIITSAPTAAGTAGSSFSYQIAATNNPTSFGATGLPAGLSADAVTGLISGTPSSAGTTTVTISAANAAGSGSASLSLTINNPAPQAPVITSVLAAAGTVGSAFLYQITASNSPTSFSAGGLPAGLSVNAATGFISGTPTSAGTFNASIGAANGAGSGSATLGLTINAAPAPGQTITAPTCSQTDVQNALNQAQSGDTVLIPAGTCTWATTVSIKAAGRLTVLGAGPGQTVIQDNVPGALATVNLSSGAFLRLGGMTLQPLPGEIASANTRVIYIVGTCAASGCSLVRLDHLQFTGWIYNGWAQPGNNFNGFVMTASDVFGVLDHLNVLATTFGEFVNIGYSNYLGVGAYGDNSWASPDSFGTGNALYIEDSTFTETGTANFAVTDTDDAPYGGARFVVRHNLMTNFAPTTHGTETTGRTRGGRQFELYANSFTCTNPNGCNTAIEMRSGTAMVFNNAIGSTSSSWWNTVVKLSAYRTFASLGGWGWCDGTGPWDQNDGVVYDAGAYTGPSGGSTTIVDAAKSWAANQWTSPGAPYSIHNVTQGFGYEISGNTSNSINVSNYSQDYWNGPPQWNTGDAYQILRARACIDQPGRGQGTLLSGNTPSPTGWVNEPIDPTYEWGDVFTGGHLYWGWVGADTGRIIANRDYYSQVSPFDGSSGTGTGALSNRPATCATGVAYWATDANTLYQCSAPNTWIVYYQPYPYPHPLVAGSTAAVAAVPAITSPSTASGTTGNALSYQIAASNSPTSYGASGLPAGLSVNTSNGVISGTPAAAGVSNVAISASNAAGTGSATLTLTVGNGPIGNGLVAISLSPASATLQAGATLQLTATVTGASNTAVLWSATAGAVSSSGLFTAPSSGGTATVTATSLADPAKSASALLTILPPPAPPAPSTFTFVQLVWDPAVAGQAILALRSNDPAFPSAPTLSATLALPSGPRSLTLSQLAAGPWLRYFAKLPAALFSPQDFFAPPSTSAVTVGAQTFPALFRARELEPALGGLVIEPVGAAQVLVNPGGLTQDAQITLNPMPPDPSGARAAALKRQNLLLLDPGRDIVMASSGTLNLATLTLPFDPALIPSGMTAAAVRIAYFNAASGAWELLGATSVLAGSGAASLSPGLAQAPVTHLSPYATVLLMPDAAPGLRDCLVYPSPALAGQDPTIRAFLGLVDRVDVTIFDASGQKVASFSSASQPTGIFNGQYYYDLPWTGPKASGVYFAVVHGHASGGTLLKARASFALLR